MGNLFVTNLDRAKAFRGVLLDLVKQTGCSEEEALVDLLSNAAHYCRMRNVNRGDIEESFREAVASAAMQHELEFNEDPEGASDADEAQRKLLELPDTFPGPADPPRRPRP
ncbi:hypothetical protein ABIC83_002988 [Roseateles asaccharophilus]|uniref:hypothetical protein n=1 Tax=Roseateles asaccharophilus TaxID=582607 RepID=UPI0038377260